MAANGSSLLHITSNLPCSLGGLSCEIFPVDLDSGEQSKTEVVPTGGATSSWPTPNRPSRRPTDHVHMVSSYFEGAESVSGLGLTQFQCTFQLGQTKAANGPRLRAETWLPDLGHDPQVGSPSGPQPTPMDARPKPTPTNAQLTPTDIQPTPVWSWVTVLGPWGPIRCGMWG